MLRSLLTTSAGTLITAILGALVMKLIALIGGPASVAIFGQLRQILTMATLTAMMNGGPSLITGLAAREAADRDDFLTSIGALTIGATLVAGGVTFLLAPQIAEWAFPDAAGSIDATIRFLPLVMIASTGAAFLGAVLVGRQHFKHLALLQIVGACGSLLVVGPALNILEDETRALLLILAVNPLVMLAAFAFKIRWSSLGLRLGKIDRAHMSHHLRMSLAMFLVGAIHALTPMIARALYMEHWGLTATGWFEAAYVLGGGYVGLFLHAAGTVFLPRLSQETTPAERTRILADAFRLVMIVGGVLLALGLATRSYLLLIFFSEAFLPAREIIWWMLIYDVLRFGTWCCTILMVSARNYWAYFINELIGAVCFIAVVAALIDQSVEAGGIAYLIAGTVQFVGVFLYATIKYKIRWPKRSFLIGGTISVLIAGFAVANPPSAHSAPLSLLVWAAIAPCVVWALSTAEDRAQAWAWIRATTMRS